ncbi:MAG: hypothetical protein L0241_30250 [Planctomycetia bacterium]|nr:hypothetical protein [Planctomycetia bacterium]
MSVVSEAEPELSRDSAGRIVLRALNNPHPADPEGSQFDYEVFLDSADIERLRLFLAPVQDI